MDRYEDSLKVYRDLNNVIDTAFSEGVQEGLLEGEKKRTLEIAKALKAGGAALELIISATGLTAAEIDAL